MTQIRSQEKKRNTRTNTGLLYLLSVIRVYPRKSAAKIPYQIWQRWSGGRTIGSPALHP